MYTPRFYLFYSIKFKIPIDIIYESISYTIIFPMTFRCPTFLACVLNALHFTCLIVLYIIRRKIIKQQAIKINATRMGTIRKKLFPGGAQRFLFSSFSSSSLSNYALYFYTVQGDSPSMIHHMFIETLIFTILDYI